MRYLNILLLVLATIFGAHAPAQVNPIAAGAMGGQNYILNGGFENARHGWASYADAAANIPADGTGGSPTAGLLTTTNSALAGKTSGLINHPASNIQGQGVSYDFVVEGAAAGRVMSIQGVYQIVSGTYTGSTATTDSDLEIYVYDKDSGTLIYPSNYKLDGTAGNVRYPINVSFAPISQTSSNYRLIFHSATTTTNAWSMKIDSLAVSLSPRAYGPAASDMTAFTQVVGAVTTAPTKPTGRTETATWDRQGDKVHVRWNMKINTTNSGTSGSGCYLFNMPPGMTMDSTKIVVDPQVGVGFGRFYSASAGSSGQAIMVPVNSTQLQAIIKFSPDGQGQTTTTVCLGSTAYSFAENAGSGYFFDYTVPVAGWSTGVAQSADADQRPASGQAATSANTTPGNAVIIPFTSVAFDSHGGYQANGQYKVQQQGYYRVTYTGINTSGTCNIIFYRNGVLGTALTSQSTTQIWSGSNNYLLNAGDLIDLRPDAACTIASGSRFMIDKTGGSALLQQTDTYAAEYYNVASVSLPSGGNVAVTGWTRIHDSAPGQFNAATGVFQPTVAGRFVFGGQVATASTSWSATQIFGSYLVKNASCGTTPVEPARSAFTVMPTITVGAVAPISGSFQLTPNDYVSVCAVNGASQAVNTYSSSNDRIHLSITRVAN